jgi:DNA-binding CsgD family transcriptional regulator
MTASEGDLRALLDVIESGYSDAPGMAMPGLVLQGVMDLIGCDVIAFNEMDIPQRRHGSCDSHPDEDDDADDAMEPVFWRFFDSCLPCSYAHQSGDLRSVTQVSDFYSEREWHAHPMWTEYAKQVGIDAEIMVNLPPRGEWTPRLLLFRSDSRPFSERDRLLLCLLRPHLQAVYLDAVRRRAGDTDLTPRQRELLRLVAAGYSTAEIARHLFISQGTVRKHLENIFERLSVSSRTAAVARLAELAG